MPSARQLVASDGRALVLAMDHGRCLGAVNGLERPGDVLNRLANHIDAALLNYGALKQFGDIVDGRVPLVMRLDGGESNYRSDWLAYDSWRRLYSPDDAADAGAAGVATMSFLGAGCELDTFAITARTAVDAARRGVPLMVEALPCPGPRIPDPTDAKAMADAARVAFEHGADLIKNYFTGTVEGYTLSVEAVPIPVLIAGGERMASTRDVLTTVHDAMTAGAAGAVIGRNIWQHKDMVGMTRALAAIIHDGASVDAAYTHVNE